MSSFFSFLFFFWGPCVWFCTFQLHCHSTDLDTTQDMYKFIDKMSNGNSLEGLTCWTASYWNLFGQTACLQFGQLPCNHSQAGMSGTSTFWLACTEYRLVPYSPCMWFKNTRFNIRNVTKFTTLSTFHGHYSFPRRDIPGKPFCTALLSVAPAYVDYYRYVHNHICVLAFNYPLLYRYG